jgi:hypothetical protein
LRLQTVWELLSISLSKLPDSVSGSFITIVLLAQFPFLNAAYRLRLLAAG